MNQPSQQLKYADVIRRKMKTADNPFARPLSIRELAQVLGYSYEHLRKCVNGEPVASKDFSDILCDALGLDKTKMWELARYEKVVRKFKAVPLSIAMPSDKRLSDKWPKLTDEQRARIVHIAEAYVMENEADATRLRSFLADKTPVV